MSIYRTDASVLSSPLESITFSQVMTGFRFVGSILFDPVFFDTAYVVTSPNRISKINVTIPR